MHMHVHAWVCTCMHMYVNVCICTLFMLMYIHVCICEFHGHVHSCMHMQRSGMRMYVCVRVCVYTDIYTRTYKHARIITQKNIHTRTPKVNTHTYPEINTRLCTCTWTYTYTYIKNGSEYVLKTKYTHTYVAHMHIQNR